MTSNKRKFMTTIRSNVMICSGEELDTILTCLFPQHALYPSRFAPEKELCAIITDINVEPTAHLELQRELCFATCLEGLSFQEFHEVNMEKVADSILAAADRASLVTRCGVNVLICFCACHRCETSLELLAYQHKSFFTGSILGNVNWSFRNPIKIPRDVFGNIVRLPLPSRTVDPLVEPQQGCHYR